jgi:hypothetical protein
MSSVEFSGYEFAYPLRNVDCKIKNYLKTLINIQLIFIVKWEVRMVGSRKCSSRDIWGYHNDADKAAIPVDRASCLRIIAA